MPYFNIKMELLILLSFSPTVLILETFESISTNLKTVLLEDFSETYHCAYGPNLRIRENMPGLCFM